MALIVRCDECKAEVKSGEGIEVSIRMRAPTAKGPDIQINKDACSRHCAAVIISSAAISVEEHDDEEPKPPYRTPLGKVCVKHGRKPNPDEPCWACEKEHA